MSPAEFQLEAVIVSAVGTGATASWVLWSSSTEKAFYVHWIKGRLGAIRVASVAAHAGVGVLAAYGAATAKWYPFGDTWFANGVAYAAAAEGVIRANVAGLQVSATGKVWSLANSAATRLSSNLKGSSRTRIQNHLSGLSDEELATFTSSMRQVLRFTDRDKAAILDANLADAASGGTPSRALLLRIATSAAADAYWRRDEDAMAG